MSKMQIEAQSIIKLGPVDKTFAGLRDAIFDEINLLRSGDTTIQKARATASLARQAIDSVAVELAYTNPKMKVIGDGIQAQEK